ncbi:hypothetical protein DDZ14_17065 [Maritimibacter sp. 55A14]|uniref:SseB family protein n=1 Tax=Maritimibacter sp. 55A14 TaxID=2174844 RepID=UPI000D60FC6E|nr:SseB family protein [Maritimibacter sp. 55A14]PWE29456.1 hypothetical protein DDZ14_17065 [Maritimibacter sp. 55A14]
MTETPLDAALARMQAAPEDAAARLAAYHLIAASELVLLLETEAEGDRISPATFPVDGAGYVLVFDREDRLTAFTGGPAPYAALSGRSLAQMLAGQGLGLGVNLSEDEAGALIPAGAVDWLAGALGAEPAVIEARPVALSPPRGLPEGVLISLDTRLASAWGLATAAWLAAVEYEDGARGHLLAFVDALEPAQPALTRAVGEALGFSGLEADALDVAFLVPDAPLAARLARVGLRFDLPTADRAPVPAAPGSDPDRPPRLR